MNEGEQQLLRKIAHVSLLLDGYDDLFSDFDPRPYSQRRLSDDFMVEAKKAVKDKASGSLELLLLLPAAKRKPGLENVIRRRLRDYFTKFYESLQRERQAVIRQGALFIILGFCFMVITTFILIYTAKQAFLLTLLIVILEPAGWFLFWEGLNLIIFESKRKAPDMRFYEKMASCAIGFHSY